MSYLTLPEGIPDFSKAVISFWFRVPQASIDAARELYESNPDPLSLSNGIVPLVVLGERGTGQTPVTYPTVQMLQWNIYANYIAGPNFSLNPRTTLEFLDGGIAQYTSTQNLECYWTGLPAPYNPIIIYKTDQPHLTTTGPAPQADPTYIGVDGYGRLYINFQTGQQPQVSAWQFSLESITPGLETNALSDYGGYYLGNVTGDPYDSSAAYFVQGTRITQQHGFDQPVVILDDFHNMNAPGGHTITYPVEHWVDVSTIVMDATGVITNDGSQDVTADEWHHVLIPIDLQDVRTHGISDPAGSYEGPIANYVDSAVKLYVSLDDINYTQYDLSSYWVDGAGDNDVMTDDAWSIAGSYPATDDEGASRGTAQYLIGSPTISSDVKPLGIPAIAEFVNGIYPIEMAEFQMFTGVILDTGIMTNRRVFIDADGKPVSPAPVAAPDDPSAPLLPPAERLLGKQPDILLHGSGNWIIGKNTGPMIDNPDYNPDLPVSATNPIKIPDPEKQFTPTGQIVSYTPDPSLHGPQSPDEAPVAVSVPRYRRMSIHA